MRKRFRHSRAGRISFFSFQDILMAVTGILVLVTLILSFQLDPSALPQPSPAQPPNTDLPALLASVRASNSVLLRELTAAATAPATAQLEGQVERLNSQLQSASNRLITLSTQQTNLLQLAASNQALGTDLAAMRDQHDQQQQALEQEQKRTNRAFVIRGPAPVGKHPALVVVSGASIWLQLDRGDGREETQQWAGPNLVNQFRAAIDRYPTGTVYLVFLVKPSGINIFEQCLPEAVQAGFQVGYEPLLEHL